MAAVTWDRGYDGATATLALCVHGDPWVKTLPLTAWRWDTMPAVVRALLEPIRSIVEANGARVEDRDEPATDWWYLDPDARRS